jgi:hypothetical protein
MPLWNSCNAGLAPDAPAGRARFRNNPWMMNYAGCPFSRKSFADPHGWTGKSPANQLSRNDWFSWKIEEVTPTGESLSQMQKENGKCFSNISFRLAWHGEKMNNRAKKMATFVPFDEIGTTESCMNQVEVNLILSNSSAAFGRHR